MDVIVPRDWRLLRGLLTALGLVALVLATLTLTDPTWVPGGRTKAVFVAAYVGAPAALVVAALVLGRRPGRLRLPVTPAPWS